MRKDYVKPSDPNNTYHDFYCDECGIFLTTTSGNDLYLGYRDFLIKIDVNKQICSPDGVDDNERNIRYGDYEFSKCLCPKCRDRFVYKLTNVLTDLGFNKIDK